jgi:hypothetical protein
MLLPAVVANHAPQVSILLLHRMRCRAQRAPWELIKIMHRDLRATRAPSAIIKTPQARSRAQHVYLDPIQTSWPRSCQVPVSFALRGNIRQQQQRFVRLALAALFRPAPVRRLVPVVLQGAIVNLSALYRSRESVAPVTTRLRRRPPALRALREIIIHSTPAAYARHAP